MSGKPLSRTRDSSCWKAQATFFTLSNPRSFSVPLLSFFVEFARAWQGARSDWINKALHLTVRNAARK